MLTKRVEMHLSNIDPGPPLDLTAMIGIGILILVSVLLLIFVLFIRCRYLRRRNCSLCSLRVGHTGLERVEGFWQRIWHEACWDKRMGLGGVEKGGGRGAMVELRSPREGKALVSPRSSPSTPFSPASPMWKTGSPAYTSSPLASPNLKGPPGGAPLQIHSSGIITPTTHYVGPAILPMHQSQPILPDIDAQQSHTLRVTIDPPNSKPPQNGAQNAPQTTPAILLPPRSTSRYISPLRPSLTVHIPSSPSQKTQITHQTDFSVRSDASRTDAQRTIAIYASHMVSRHGEMGSSNPRRVLTKLPPRITSRPGETLQAGMAV